MSLCSRHLWPRFSLRTLFVVVTAFAGLFGLYAFSEWSRRKQEAFDAAAWRDTRPEAEARRLTMADGLVARQEFVGKTRHEVVQMLGEPPPPEYFRDWDMVYRLGMERGFISIDSEWLVIRLGTNGRVTESRIVHD